ncbi:hypothetical protein GobsT_53950 [Gemmata obscuriglobus]|uniref:PhnA-like protein n=1 Tax=Gemmata obscuriglobus TaxID=114 RepID=A0A2Z3GSL6_9BACT|nr:hypothetical protein [Gemmata obscuriglobus]AWM36753.1 hypothetical protein C1280_06790 [Gemmata obscuriglobus]QEG30590.1 hypothetical protein GobsT_53950 [Gemmata obscuriglobus]VTS09914.1 Uncharacterized protein OS=Singulisphaera acidiphila (strain ATCC BAA-1392 / DSM 18658 / VKM B-2454 / MOB10) GN=Sinac_3607 PE=4 SV=1 [Gemmata obscuriglobus UQM 2246]
MAIEQLKMEDVTGVRSRLSWPAILAGAICAVATNLVLTLFFGAIGLTIAEAGVRANAIGVGALVAALLSIIVALFVGGWVSTQLTAGENEREAVLYGILTWALVVGFSLALVGMGARAGYFALVGGSMVAAQSPAAQNWEQSARDAGVSQERIDAWKANMDPNKAREAAADPATRERAERAAIGASWAALVGVMLSMAAAIGGAMAGRGVAFRLLSTGRAIAIERREVAVS